MIVSLFTHGLSSKPLTGPNYLEWKRNLKYVLVAEEYYFALTDPKPPELTDESSNQEREAMRKWVKANNTAHSYIMTSMSPALQLQNEDIQYAVAVMLNLEELFGGKNRPLELMRKILNSKMTEGASVNEHVLGLMQNMNELDQLGGGVDSEAKTNIILNSLPKCFEIFRLNAVMHKKVWTLNELLNELMVAEGVMRKKSSQALLTGRFSSSTSKGGKRKRSERNKKGKKPRRSKGGTSDGAKKAKGKGRCFKCNQAGHWKSNCPSLKKKQGISRDEKDE